MPAERGRETENELEVGGKHRGFFCFFNPLSILDFDADLQPGTQAAGLSARSHMQEGGPKLDGTKPANQHWLKCAVFFFFFE